MGRARITVKESAMNSSGETEEAPMTQEETAAAKHSRNETLAHDDPSSGGNLEKIRDILFGAQLRDHDRRFAQLEQYILRDSAALRQDLQRRLDTLEGSMREEVEALASRLTQEQEARSGSVTHLTHEINQLVSTLGAKAQHLENQRASAQRDLEQQIRTRSSELATDIQTKYAELTNQLDRAVEGLRASKTDRSSLAAILMEASQRLADDHSSSEHR